MTRSGIFCVISLPGQVGYLKEPRKGALLQSKEASVIDPVKCAVTKYFDERLMIRINQEIVAALGEIPSLLKAPGNG